MVTLQNSMCVALAQVTTSLVLKYENSLAVILMQIELVSAMSLSSNGCGIRGHEASIDQLRLETGLRNFDTVLVLFDELETFLTAKDVFRLAITSSVRWANRRARPLRVMRFVLSEALPGRVQLYPTKALHIGIVFDKQLSMEICYEHFFHIQDCDQLQRISLTLTEVPNEYQLLDFQLLLTEYLGLLLQGRSGNSRLRLVLRFPYSSRRYQALCTGHAILHQLDIDVAIVWRKAVFTRRFICHWASQF